MPLSMKLIIYFVVTILCALLFLFIPDFNWGGPRATSLYAQYIHTDPMVIVKRLSLLCVFVFCSLLILFSRDLKKK